MLAFISIGADNRTMLHRFLFALALFLLPATAIAQSLEGRWDMRIDSTTIFRFDITEGVGGEWQGIWSKPESFNTDGNTFGRIRGGVEQVESMTGIEFLGMVELSFDDPRPGAIPDIFRFQLLGEDQARMTYVGTELAPYTLVRAGDDDAMGNWDAQRVYRRRLPGIGDGFGDGFGVDSQFRLNPNSPDITPRPNVPAAAQEEVAADEVEDGAAEDEAPLVEPEAAEIDEMPEQVPDEGPEDAPRIGADFLSDL